MVFITKVLSASNRIRHKTFLDKCRIYVRGGSGGQGLPKFGGQGGKGGHIYVVGTEDATLSKLVRQHPKKRFIASHGSNSRKQALFGEAAPDLEIPVPVGIVVRNDDNRVLGEINMADDKVLIAKGGSGGGPSNSYLGQKGHALSVTLDLKLIADIGLVGFPNAGKSTLLSAMSRAAPKIASYPFTTVQPQLGKLVYEDLRQITMADLPGLIEGAHVNIGMGHSFLKHIERTKLMLFVVDIHGFRLSPRHPLRSAFENILLLNRELELYKEELLQKPAMLLLNKMDIEGADKLAEEVEEQLSNMDEMTADVPKEFIPNTQIKFDEIITISAKKCQNTEYLKNRLRDVLDLYADMEFDKQHSETRQLDTIKSQITEHARSKLV